MRVLAFSDQGGGEEQAKEHTGRLETSPWRHVLEHTSIPDYWRLLVLFRQLHAKVGSWCTAQRLLASWSAFASPSVASTGGGLLGGVLRLALALLEQPCSRGAGGRECCACVHGVVPDGTRARQRAALVKRSARDEFLAFFHRCPCVCERGWV